jgi:hypothetical protein
LYYNTVTEAYFDATDSMPSCHVDEVFMEYPDLIGKSPSAPTSSFPRTKMRAQPFIPYRMTLPIPYPETLEDAEAIKKEIVIVEIHEADDGARYVGCWQLEAIPFITLSEPESEPPEELMVPSFCT